MELRKKKKRERKGDFSSNSRFIRSSFHRVSSFEISIVREGSKKRQRGGITKQRITEKNRKKRQKKEICERLKGLFSLE